MKAKRNILFSLLLSFLLLFAACYGDFTVQEGAFDGVPIENDIVILKNCDDIENYLSQERFSGSNSFKDQLLAYTEEFFQEKNLIVVNIWEDSSSNKLTVRSVKTVEDEIVVTIKRKVPKVGTAAMKTHCFLIEISCTGITNVRYEIKE